jgi:hypothetical protein
LSGIAGFDLPSSFPEVNIQFIFWMKAFGNLVDVRERGCQRIFITEFTKAGASKLFGERNKG